MLHLIIDLESPLMAFGGDKVDEHAVITTFPGRSMVTGLLANALGWEQQQADRHQQLQDNLVLASRIDREPADRRPLSDYHTAAIRKSDTGWTTWGQPQARAGDGKYTTVITRRDYHQDMRVTLALRLLPAGDDQPDLHALGQALEQPTRPLFIGRQCCIPSRRLLAGYIDAPSAVDALLALPLRGTPGDQQGVRLLWQNRDPGSITGREHLAPDHRDWHSRLHGGGTSVQQATVCRDRFPIPDTPADQEEAQPSP